MSGLYSGGDVVGQIIGLLVNNCITELCSAGGIEGHYVASVANRDNASPFGL